MAPRALGPGPGAPEGAGCEPWREGHSRHLGVSAQGKEAGGSEDGGELTRSGPGSVSSWDAPSGTGACHGHVRRSALRNMQIANGRDEQGAAKVFQVTPLSIFENEHKYLTPSN